MQTQVAPPLPADPLASLESDYERAVLHLAWNLHGPPKKRTLLFAFVELLPSEIPPPEADDDDLSLRPSAQSEHRVFVRHAVMPARCAVEWYLTCRRGQAVLPTDKGNLIPDAAASNARPLYIAELGEEPPWPNLVCLDEEQNGIPFLPAWHKSPRMHHLVPLTDLNLAELWKHPKEREQAIRFLGEHLHFDIEAYPEFIGSIHLVAPNPIFRVLRVRLSPKTPPLESVLCQFDLRPGKDVTGMDLVVRELRPTGEGALSTIPVHASTVEIPFEQGVDSFAANVIDPDRGLLRVGRTPHTFIHSVQLGMSLISGTRVVEGKTPEDTLEVPIHGETERKIVGEGYRSPPGRLRLWSAHHTHERRARATALQQRFFQGQKGEAREVLQALLHEANEEVMIVDPYFGHTEMGGFAAVVGQTSVPIRILTSAELLKGEASSGQEKGNALLILLEKFAATSQMNPIEIRVMVGSRPEIHDRFILIDERVWLLGSSLNEFGMRGTMMVALPDPQPIASQLRRTWSLAQPLEAWVKERRDRKAEETSRDRDA